MIDGIKYDVIAKAKQAKVISNGYSGDIIIPETVVHNGITCNVTSIGGRAFYNCSGLVSVVIPNSVTNIGDGAFEYCSGLTSIEIPNNVTSIGNNAFYGCSGLTAVHISDLSVWCNINFGNYGSNPLYNAKNLYLNGNLVAELVIPDGITEIKNSAFSGCSCLTSVTIGSGVRYIYNYAFANCENLTDVYCLATNVPSTNSYAFSGSYPEYMTLHVSAEAINDYKTKTPWSSFGTIVALDGEFVEPEVPEEPEEPEVKICATPTISYSNGQIVIECETDGAEFITTVTNMYSKTYYTNIFDLSATYNISVYAMATGYVNSETINATLCWIENGNGENDTETNVINVPATALFITSSNSVLYINCALEDESVEIYTTNGVLIDETTIENGNAIIQTGLAKGSVAIVKIGNKSVKVILN